MVNLKSTSDCSTDLSVTLYFVKLMLLEELLKTRPQFAPLILNVLIDMIIYSQRVEKDGQMQAQIWKQNTGNQMFKDSPKIYMSAEAQQHC